VNAKGRITLPCLAELKRTRQVPAEDLCSCIIRESTIEPRRPRRPSIDRRMVALWSPNLVRLTIMRRQTESTCACCGEQDVEPRTIRTQNGKKDQHKPIPQLPRSRAESAASEKRRSRPGWQERDLSETGSGRTANGWRQSAEAQLTTEGAWTRRLSRGLRLD
jgi:hypothetical protein